MSGRRQLRVSVENLGPIRKAEVDFKPLTILIGPNNTGKSIFAELLYALFKSLRDQPSANPWAWTGAEGNQQSNDELYRLLLSVSSGSSTLILRDLPHPLQEQYGKAVADIRIGFLHSVERAVVDYLGYDKAADAVRKGAGKRPLSVTLDDLPPVIKIDSDGRASYSFPEAQPETMRVTRQGLELFAPPSVAPQLTNWGMFLARKAWAGLLSENGIPCFGLYYFPSYRSGLVHTFEIFARVGIRMLSPDLLRLGASIPRPSGILVDFLDTIISAGSISLGDDRRAFDPALEVLEGRLLGGRVEAGDLLRDQTLMLYTQGKYTYPIKVTSSMVAELAPLDILVRRRLMPGDLVILDEPEAHLHPEGQRLIARVLVRLVRAGVQVVCPTHSSLFLHQISNHLLAASAGADARQRLGFTDQDLLNADDVGVYLFPTGRNGTRVRPVPIEAGFGISEEEFLRVEESIGAETFDLSESPATKYAQVS